MTAPLAIDGPDAPPRANGELVFSAPWESRAFGMAVSLHESGAFAWSQFQSRLVARIAAWEQAPPAGECWTYYEHWLGALEDVLVAEGAVGTAEVSSRAHTLAERPAGYDHGHDHGSDHDGDEGHGHGHGHGHQ
ncbi:nitrile hydratase accessory protein [Pseudonocardia sp. GCM10023141]|uniref:nitrile hydratase accessory protein n=1 Tax=Pseudonocardia sp. GCM10023141 TaxID=3252653 RepID=UPI0036242A56